MSGDGSRRWNDWLYIPRTASHKAYSKLTCITLGDTLSLLGRRLDVKLRKLGGGE
jgi:hypothetical protein